MTNNGPEQVSATIYQFPLRGRFAAGQQRDQFSPREKAMLLRNVEVLDTDGWYHNEEMKDDHARHH